MSSSALKSEIINEILQNSDVCVKSQQVGDPEMTMNDKTAFLNDFIDSKKSSTFLSRFGKFLQPHQLAFFLSRHNDDKDEKYCIEFHIQEVMKNAKPKRSTIRNRRFAALQKLLDDKDDHFTEQEMMKREPTLYEQLVGQYLSEEEKQNRDRCDNPTFLGALLRGIEMEQLRDYQEKVTKASNEDDDEESDPEDENFDEGETRAGHSSLWGEFDDAPSRPVKPKTKIPLKNVTESDRDELKREFIEAMYLKFMNGEDNDFDYGTVDNNAEYDDLAMEDQDEQDRYFDDSDSLCEGV